VRLHAISIGPGPRYDVAACTPACCGTKARGCGDQKVFERPSQIGRDELRRSEFSKTRPFSFENGMFLGSAHTLSGGAAARRVAVIRQA